MGNVGQIAAVASACVLALSTGFSIGLVIGHPGPFISAAMTNSSVNATPFEGSATGPCVNMPHEYRCSFVGANGTWTCLARPYDAGNDTCTGAS